MTKEAVQDGCYEKIGYAIVMLEKATADLKLIKSQVEKRELALSVAMTAACSILTSSMDEISISDMLKLAAFASQLDGWGP